MTDNRTLKKNSLRGIFVDLLMLYLATLSVQTTKREMIETVILNELKGTRFCLEGLTNNEEENLSQDSRSPGRDLNP
jgi:hypothetical protein